MSGTDIKRPETQEELTKLLIESAKKARLDKAEARRKTTKPTLSATAKALNIHRDTLYTWLKELNVDFKAVMENIPTNNVAQFADFGSTYLIGEALLGEGNEVAHVDLLIGDKEGAVGKAFASGFSNLSVGHTPLLAV
jgi:hypothetical protein